MGQNVQYIISGLHPNFVNSSISETRLIAYDLIDRFSPQPEILNNVVH